MQDAQARNYAVWFALLHLAVWTLVPTLVSPNAPLDVVEGYAWGHEHLLGTYKHPPMQAWWLEILAFVTRRARFAHFLASQIAIVSALWAVWDVSRVLLDGRRALLAVLLLEGNLYFNVASTEFNPNVLQIMFWALICHAFYFSVTRDKTRYWLLLGLWSACGIYSKYSTAVLLFVLGLLLLAWTDARKKLLSVGPYLALILCLILLAPHAVWLFEHHFLPLTYIQSRVSEPGTAGGAALPVLVRFTGGQIVMLLPMLLLALMQWDDRRAPMTQNGFDLVFLWTVTFGPWFVTCLISLFLHMRLRDMWGAPFWNFASLWLVFSFLGGKDFVFRKRFLVAWGVFSALVPVIYGAIVFGSPYMGNGIKRVQFPGAELAHLVSSEWKNRYGTPLAYVIGDSWIGGEVGYYAPSRPSLFLDNDPMISSWIDPAEVRLKGGVYLSLPCPQGCPEAVYAQKHEAFAGKVHDFYPDADIRPPLVLRPETPSSHPPSVVVDWAIIPPAAVR